MRCKRKGRWYGDEEGREHMNWKPEMVETELEVS
jgi:hypothetical protein